MVVCLIDLPFPQSNIAMENGHGNWYMVYKRTCTVIVHMVHTYVKLPDGIDSMLLY